jgi:protein-S-isoprenylcysteine O-methyltransferase Ste14
MKKYIIRVATDISLAILWYTFAYNQISAFLAYQKITDLALCIAESIIIVLFLVRREPHEVTTKWYDYLVGIAGTFTAFFYIPTGGEESGIAVALVFIGVLLQIGSLLSLNRSFGIVAANRGIERGGLYNYIRHPMYASYIIIFTGYLVGNYSLYNLGVIIVALMFMLLRISREEALLSHDTRYMDYKKDVRFKLIPGLF